MFWCSCGVFFVFSFDYFWCRLVWCIWGVVYSIVYNCSMRLCWFVWCFWGDFGWCYLVELFDVLWVEVFDGFGWNSLCSGVDLFNVFVVKSWLFRGEKGRRPLEKEKSRSPPEKEKCRTPHFPHFRVWKTKQTISEKGSLQGPLRTGP